MDTVAACTASIIADDERQTSDISGLSQRAVHPRAYSEDDEASMFGRFVEAGATAERRAKVGGQAERLLVLRRCDCAAIR
ncbi:hypothetical protein [Jiella pacifica]|uniref:Uncharacterized protein n=1 Tax=Jiella pacifica TaxID=2696469 RepID=A0A6N9T439_9HYPH|nr:hypothetical protein [Jiella pacifica]NDW06031.1 hypothetical protein [Jiella pacifica]